MNDSPQQCTIRAIDEYAIERIQTNIALVGIRNELSDYGDKRKIEKTIQYWRYTIEYCSNGTYYTMDLDAMSTRDTLYIMPRYGTTAIAQIALNTTSKKIVAVHTWLTQTVGYRTDIRS